MNKRHFIYPILMILLLIVIIAGWFATDYLGNQARQGILSEGHASALTLSIYVHSTFTTIEGAVKSLSGSPWITPALLSKSDKDIEHANSALDRYNSALNASVSYLMDANGMAVASSNRKDPDSFVGKSYRFRPYFQEAAKSQPYRYFALGITSGKRGFYASYPVQNRLGKVLGVVTMKKDLDDMGIFFRKYPFCFLVSPEGIIFLSSKPEMVLKSFWPLDKTAQEKLIASRQFGNTFFETVIKKKFADGAEITLEGKDYFVSRKVIGRGGWSIVVLNPTDPILIYKLIGILTTIFVCFLIMVFSGIIYLTDRSQKAISQSEESKRLLLHAVGDGIFVMDALERTTFVNPAALRMLGFAEEEMLGQSAHTLIHHSHEDGSNYPVEDCPMYVSCANAVDSHVEDEVLWRKDGSSFPVDYFSTPITKDGKVEGAVVTFRDITKRKLIEEMLAVKNVLLSTQQEASIDGILVVDENDHILSYNRRFVELWGIPAKLVEDGVDGPVLQFVKFRIADPQSFLQRIQYLYEHRQETSQDELILADGRFVERYSAPMIGSDKRFLGRVWYFRDITERKKNEELIKSLNEQQQIILDASPTMIFYKDKENRFIRVNESMAKANGMSKKEMEGKTCWDIFPREAAESYWQNDKEVIADEKPVLNIIEEMKTPKGIMWVQTDKIPYRNSKGEIIGIIGFILDITERKQAEEAIKQSEVFLNTLLSSIPIPIFYKDRDGRYTGFNRAYENFFGATKQNLIGKTVFDISPPELAKIYHAKDNDLLESGIEQKYESQVKNTLGVTRDVIFNKAVFTDSKGVVNGLIGAILDITERKQAEEALLKSEEKYRTILENIQEGYFEVDLNGNFTFFNDSICRILGYPQEEMMGMNNRQYTDKEHSKILYQAFNKVYSTGKPAKEFDWQIIRKDGTKRYIEVSVSLLINSSGKPIGFRGIARDITERKMMEAEILALSITDQLTGLYNRRGFLSLAEQQLKLAKRNKSGMLLFFIDMDGLKGINDTLGHEEGDKALIETATLFKETFRTSDIIARMGGDEYVALAIEITETNSEIITGRLQSLIDKRNNQENRRYRLSISVGYSCYDPENPCSIDDLIERADKLMYEQKQNKKRLLPQTVPLQSES